MYPKQVGQSPPCFLEPSKLLSDLLCDFYKEHFKENLGEQGSTCAKPSIGAGVYYTYHWAFIYFMTKSGMSR